MTETVEVTGRGYGKLIVFGEHAVVYGRPAVACSLSSGAVARLSFSDDPGWTVSHRSRPLSVDDRAKKAVSELLAVFDLRSDELRIHVDLSIPVGAGLGSSAAMATALARGAAELRNLDISSARKLVDRAVEASEAVFHGKPSGIDQRAASGQGFFSFRRGDDALHIEPLEVPDFRWVVARVAPSPPTSEMVASVAAMREEKRESLTSVFDDIGSIAERGAAALRQGRWSRVGELMNRNQVLLASLGVSSPALDRACEAARQAGALGAKLTGAGGGGCILAAAGNEHGVDEVLCEFGDVYSFVLPTAEHGH